MTGQLKRIQFETSLILATIFVITLILLAWFVVGLIDDAKMQIKSELEVELARLERSFTDKMEHTSSIMSNINSQIALNPHDKKYIAQILNSYHANQNLIDDFAWTSFSWANSQYQIVVDANNGILEKPADLSTRSYIYQSEKQTGIFQLGTPGIGETSKKWILPGGIGIKDKKGNYLGTTTIGFEVEKIAKILHDVIKNKNVSFRLFSKNGAYILRGNLNSVDIKEDVDDSINNNDLNKIISEVNSQCDKYFNQISFFDNQAIMAKKIQKMPYILVVQYNKKIIRDKLLNAALLRANEIVSILFSFIVLIILIYREIKQTKRLLRMKFITERAHNAKSEFLTKVTNEFKNFIFAIHGSAQIIKDDSKRIAKSIKQEHNSKLHIYLRDLETNIDLSQNIIEASHDLQSFIDEISQLSKSKDEELKIKTSSAPLNITKIIQSSISDLNKKIKTAKLYLICDIRKDLHKLVNLDAKHVKHIIHNLIFNAISHSKNGAKIWITAKNLNFEEIKKLQTIHGIKKNKAIEIIIRDENYHVSYEEIKMAIHNIKNFNKFDFLSKTLPSIKFLIEKQGGIFEISSDQNSGNEIKIIF